MYEGIEIRHLRYFSVLSEELHFGRAAERLHMSQAPFSQQIRQLEERVGTTLFHRTTRKVQLSEAGYRFRDYADRILTDLDEAVRFARDSTAEEAGRIRAGCVLVAAAYVLPQAMRRMREMHPAVMVTPVFQTTGAQVQMMLDGVIDIAFIRPTALPSYLRAEVIFSEGMCVAMPKDHPLAKKKSLMPMDLNNLPLMRFVAKLGTGFEPLVVRELKELGVTYSRGEEYTDTSAGLCKIAAGFGVALMPRSAAMNAYPNVAYRPIQLDNLHAEVMMVTRAGRLDRKLTDFCDIIRNLPPPEGAIWEH